MNTIQRLKENHRWEILQKKVLRLKNRNENKPFGYIIDKTLNLRSNVINGECEGLVFRILGSRSIQDYREYNWNKHSFIIFHPNQIIKEYTYKL